MNELADKTIFLTGGAAGIGRMCARAYIRAGARWRSWTKMIWHLETLRTNSVRLQLLTFAGDVSGQK